MSKMSDYKPRVVTKADAYIPAVPGTYVISECGSYWENLSFEQEPIIAWKIDGEVATPVCCESTMSTYWIMYPDGIIVAPEEAVHPNFDAFLAARKEHYERIGKVKKGD